MVIKKPDEEKICIKGIFKKTIEMTTGMKVEIGTMMKGVRNKRPGNCEREVNVRLLKLRYAFTYYQTKDLSINIIPHDMIRKGSS